jgi:pimeloyl-ACP methyl ester carboxylesterase
MPYANNRGIRLYYEVEGGGPPLVLGHGLGGDLNSWRRFGYVDALRDDYELILPDFRGHGRSDKPHDPSDYGSKMVDDVVAVLDHLDISRAHYMGYSMGAAIGFRLAKRYPERFTSFILGGMSPYRSSAADLSVDVVQMEGFKLLCDDPEAYAARREQQLGRSLTTEERSALLANDPEALIAFIMANPGNPLPGNEDLARIAVPCLPCDIVLSARHGPRTGV